MIPSSAHSVVSSLDETVITHTYKSALFYVVFLYASIDNCWMSWEPKYQERNSQQSWTIRKKLQIKHKGPIALICAIKLSYISFQIWPLKIWNWNNRSSRIASKRKGQLAPMDSKPKQEDILNAILPPREWVENGKHYIQYVSHQQATRVDVAKLRELLDQKLMERQARESGICPVREELFAQCFDEIIRQVTLSEPERGLLLLRVRDEIKMTIAAY